MRHWDLQHDPSTGWLAWHAQDTAGDASPILVYNSGLQVVLRAEEIMDAYELAAFALFPGQQEFVAASHHRSNIYIRSDPDSNSRAPVWYWIWSGLSWNGPSLLAAWNCRCLLALPRQWPGVTLLPPLHLSPGPALHV